MHCVEDFAREHMMTIWDFRLDSESTARLIDAFVNSLNLADYVIKEMSSEVRSAYDSKSLLKLYIYGSDTGIKSSCKPTKKL